MMKEVSDRAGTVDPAMLVNYRKQIISQIEQAEEHVATDGRASTGNGTASRPRP